MGASSFIKASLLHIRLVNLYKDKQNRGSLFGYLYLLIAIMMFLHKIYNYLFVIIFGNIY